MLACAALPCCVCVWWAAGSSFFGAISNVWRSAGGGAASSPQETVKALQAELSTWETLAQVRRYIQKCPAAIFIVRTS